MSRRCDAACRQSPAAGAGMMSQPETPALPIHVRIETFREGTFSYAPDGTGLLAKQHAVIDHDELIDVVAWPLDAASPWWTYRGLATLLGEGEIRTAWWEQRFVRLVETPQDYLDR